MAELTRLEEIEVQKYIENLLGLRPQLQKHQWQRDLDRSAMYLGAQAKAFDLGLNEEKLKDALGGLPYQGRYTQSDVQDIQKGLLGKYQDIPLVKTLIPSIDKYGGHNAAYIAMMQYSPSTLDKGDLFSYWHGEGKLGSQLVQDSLMDLEYKGL